MSSAKVHSDLAAAEIISGPRVYVRRKLYYTGHATTTYSVDQASTIIDLIGNKTQSDHCLPFAIRLVEGGEMISIAEDNGEYGCGEILKACLTKVEGFNILVCVSQHVDGMFVTDMIQSQKHYAIKQAAIKVLELLKDHLTNNTNITKKTDDILPQLTTRDSFYFDSKKVNLPSPSIVPHTGIGSNSLSQQTASGSTTWKVDC